MSDHFDINNVEPFTGGHSGLRAFIGLKDLLVAAGGSVLGSSRGSGKTFGAADYWSVASIDAGLFATGAAGCWIVIELADGARTLLLSHFNGTTQGYMWNVAVSVDGSWALGASTATAVAVPTNYDNLWGTISPAGFGSFMDADIKVRGLRWNAFARSDGSFWFMSWRTGVSICQTMLSFDVLTEYATGDADPCTYCAGYVTGGFLYNTGPFSYPYAFFNYVAAPYAGDWARTPGLYYVSSGVVVAPGCGSGGSAYGTGKINPHTDTWDVLPFYYGRSASQGAVGAFKGRSSLFEITPGNHGLTNLSVTLDKDRAVFTPVVVKDWVQGEVLEF